MEYERERPLVCNQNISGILMRNLTCLLLIVEQSNESKNNNWLSLVEFRFSMDLSTSACVV